MARPCDSVREDRAGWIANGIGLWMTQTPCNERHTPFYRVCPSNLRSAVIRNTSRQMAVAARVAMVELVAARVVARVVARVAEHMLVVAAVALMVAAVMAAAVWEGVATVEAVRADTRVAAATAGTQ